MQKTNNNSTITREVRCWVPNCSTTSNKKLFSLPDNEKSKEIWLALAGKAITSPGEQICFCSEHFSPTEMLKIEHSFFINSLPLRQMPEKICRLCLSIIESVDSSGNSIYILSKFIPTEMPSCIEEILSYFVPSNPEPLLKMVSFCIPELDIQCNPPPLLCESCFINIWLLYIFKLSAIEVEKTLRDNLPIENYSKMVLCRSCPVRFGTNFLVVAEDSNKGQLLKKIFKGDSNEKDPLPLRLCKKCFDVLGRLENFYKMCQIAEAKMRRHLEMERDIAQRRNSSNEFRRMLLNRRQDISTLLKKSPQTKRASHWPKSSSSDVNMGFLKCYTVETPEKTKISLSQWMKETLAKMILKHGQNLRKESDNDDKVFKNWCVIRDEMVKCGISCEVPELINIWDELIGNTQQKCEMKLPLDYLNELIVQYWKGNNEFFSNSPIEGTQSKRSLRELRRSRSINEDNGIGSANHGFCMGEMSRSPSNSSAMEVDLEPPVLLPQKAIVSRRGAQKDPFWNDSKELLILELIEKEALRFKKDGDNHKMSWRGVIKNVIEENPIFKGYSVASIYYRINDMRSKSQNPKKKEFIKRISTYFGSETLKNNKPKVIEAKRVIPTKPKQRVGRPRSYTIKEQLTLVKEMSKQFEILKRRNLNFSKPPWRNILQRLVERNFLKMNSTRLYNLWTKMSISAKTHSKDEGDAVDTEVWELLQSYKRYQEMKSKVKSEQNESSVSKTKDEKIQDNKVAETDGNETADEDDTECNSESVPDDETEKSDEDDQFEEKFENKMRVNTSKTPQREPENLQFNKLEFVRAMKREFKIMYESKEQGLSKPFFKIIQRLSQKEYSKCSTKDLQNRWRNMKCVTSTHQKRGTLTELDRAVLGLVNYKKERQNYENKSDNSSDDADKSSSDSEDEEKNVKSQNEDEEKGKPLSVNELLLNNKSFLKAIKTELKNIYKEEPGKLWPFRTVFQRLTNNYKEFCLLKDKWQEIKEKAYENRKRGGYTEEDNKVLKLVLFSRSQKTQKSIAGGKDTVVNPNDAEKVPCLSYIDKKMLVRDIQTELNCIVQEEKNFFLPLHEVFVRLHKRAYHKYRLNEIERQWMNMQQNAFKHKKKGVMTEEDKIFFEIVSTSVDYRKNRSSTSRPSSASTITSSIHEYDENSRTSIDSDIKTITKNEDLETSGPSTSKEKPPNNAVPSCSKAGRKKSQWSENDMLILFKLIKQEYYNLLKIRAPLPAKPWAIVVKQIAEKKLFKCSDEKELSRLWLKMKHNFFQHENTCEMTPLDWKVSRLISKYNQNMGIKVNPNKPFVLNKRPRRKYDAESDNDDSPSTEKEVSKKLKLDLINIMRQFGKEAFVRLDRKMSPWPKVSRELKRLGHTLSVDRVRSVWHYMITRAKRAMADQTQPNDVDRPLIEFMEEVMRMKTEKLIEESDREECTREDLKQEPLSEGEQPSKDNENEDDDESEGNENESEDGDNETNDFGKTLNSKVAMDYQYISLRDIEANEKRIPFESIKNETLNIKTDPIDPFSDYSSEDSTEIPDQHSNERQSHIKKEIPENLKIEEEIDKSKADEPKAVSVETGSVIDLCSDVELDELLPDVDED